MVKQRLKKVFSFQFLKIVPVFLLFALGAWAFASPVGSSPDDDFHLTSIWCANSLNEEFCAPGDSPTTRTVPAFLLEAPCFAYDPEQSAVCQNSIDSSMNPTELTSRGNFAGGYPPLFYGLMSFFAGDDVQTSVLLMRFVNIALFLALISATYFFLPEKRRGTLVWSWLITSVPFGAFLVASNNPSSWALIGVGISWIAFLGFLETTSRPRTMLAILTFVSALIAAGARADAAVYACLGYLVVVILKFKREIFTPKFVTFSGLLLLVCLTLYLSTTQALSALNGFGNPVTAVGGFGGEVESISQETPSTFALLAFNILNSPQLWEGAFGSWGLGWLDTDMPSIVYLGSLAVFVSVAFIGFGNLTKRKVYSLIIVGTALWALPVYVLTRGGSHVGIEVQPRYILPLILLLAGVLLLKVRSGALNLSRGQAFLVAATLAVSNFVALHFNIRRYVTGIDSMGWNLDADVEWWWTGFISPMSVLIIGSISFAIVVFIIAKEVKLTPSLLTPEKMNTARSVHE